MSLVTPIGGIANTAQNANSPPQSKAIARAGTSIAAMRARQPNDQAKCVRTAYHPSTVLTRWKLPKRCRWGETVTVDAVLRGFGRNAMKLPFIGYVTGGSRLTRDHVPVAASSVSLADIPLPTALCAALSRHDT